MKTQWRLPLLPTTTTTIIAVTISRWYRLFRPTEAKAVARSNNNMRAQIHSHFLRFRFRPKPLPLPVHELVYNTCFFPSLHLYFLCRSSLRHDTRIHVIRLWSYTYNFRASRSTGDRFKSCGHLLVVTMTSSNYVVARIFFEWQKYSNKCSFRRFII